MNQKVLILDFGSQYTQLIARRVREHNVYCEIVPYHANPDLEDGIQAVILSGSPFSVRGKDALDLNLDKYLGEIPVLSICYGAQLIAHKNGGRVEASNKREYGKAELDIKNTEDPIFKHIDPHSQVWMSHADSILEIPDGYEILAGTKSIPIACYKSISHEHSVYGLQFHPEVTHSEQGSEIIGNFLFEVAGCKADWTPAVFVDETIAELRETIGEDHVLMALSGGVDSSVGAMLLHKAIGERLHCFFINNGLLRKNEFNEVLDLYEHLGLNIKGIDRTDYFYSELAGVSDPETKRKRIGNAFIKVFEEEAKAVPGIKWLGQGTIYPDVIESISVHGPSATIKSHHNVGGLPEKMDLKIVEPLRMLFKDEVRKVGASIGLPDHILQRHPFPGPGLAIRILGDISAQKVQLLQEADHIYIQKLKEYDLYDKVWQAGTILLPVQSVGVMGDERTYESVVALRAVNSKDGMTAEWSKLPYDFLADVSSTIINEVKGINRVVYDISTKPPSTIEWE